MNLQEFYNDLEANLKKKIGEKIKVWVWPEHKGVKGFYGNGVINNSVVIWITERPSSKKRKLNKFPADDNDRIFYRMLREEGLRNMHLTDFVKIMERAGVRPSQEELDYSAKWMKKEIKMLKVKNKKLIIIPNLKIVKEWMGKYLPEYAENCTYIQFFKYFTRFGSRSEKLRGKLKEIYKKTF